MGVLRAAAAMALLAAVLAGCDDADPAAVPRPSTAGTPQEKSESSTAAASAGCDAVEARAVAPTAVLVPGPSNGLSRSPADGERLVIVGTVLEPGCIPAAGATLEIHHTDARGAYGPASEECCYYAGVVRTDENGRFKLDTVRPGQYAQTNAPPPHIHLAVRHPDGELNTEIVFVGDPGVPTTPVDGYSPVQLEGRTGGGTRPPWHGEVTLVLKPGPTTGA